MPAASLDAVLRAGLRLQAEAPERFEAEATGVQLCELRKKPGFSKKKSKTPEPPKELQFPSVIERMEYKKHRKGIFYTFKKVQLTPPEKKGDITYSLQYEPHPGANFLSDFGMLSFPVRSNKPVMRVTKVLVFRDDNASPPQTTFLVGYKIAFGVPADNQDPKLTNVEHFDIPPITFSEDMCKTQKTIVDGLTNYGWVPTQWKKGVARGDTRLQAATTDMKNEVAYMVMQMAEAIKKINK